MQAQKAEIEFDLVVPEKGTVTGHLYYFPFENERETVPMDPTQQQQPATGTAGALVLTQQPAGTQLALTQGPARNSPEPEGEAQCFSLTLLLLHTSAILLV